MSFPIKKPVEDRCIRFKSVRSLTEELAKPLSPEDCLLQAEAFVSPTKWHLAHTTWFFETFLLKKYSSEYQVFHPQFEYLFNSYYQTMGPFHPRSQRGLLSQPPLDQIYQYRRYVNEHLISCLENADAKTLKELVPLLELGLNHEQQHQELILMDIKYNFSLNPLNPFYQSGGSIADVGEKYTHTGWVEFSTNSAFVGYEGRDFAFDNEKPRHQVYLQPFRVSTRLVTNGDYLEFMEDGGYQHPEHWLSDGWDFVQRSRWESPLYWQKVGQEWHIYTLSGLCRLKKNEPVCHVSFYEADAFARWAGKRLLTEAEWETAAADLAVKGNFAENRYFHPIAAPSNDLKTLQQFYGDVWEWTSSSYRPHPGFKPLSGALGEYNGKFMCNQIVLKGGSCVTAASHLRQSYRNFFSPEARWVFAGIRLAEDIER